MKIIDKYFDFMDKVLSDGPKPQRKIQPGKFEIKTDFRNPRELLRCKKQIGTLNQPSQVHEFVIQYLLANHHIRGINFIVKDPLRVIIEVQIQIYWWQKFFFHSKWKRICRELSKTVTEKMPVGLCNIKPI